MRTSCSSGNRPYNCYCIIFYSVRTTTQKVTIEYYNASGILKFEFIYLNDIIQNSHNSYCNLVRD